MESLFGSSEDSQTRSSSLVSELRRQTASSTTSSDLLAAGLFLGIAHSDEMRLRGSAGWGKVEDIESESLLPTPPVYLQVIDDVNG